jgi:soluble lytic murein transglycosylase
MQLMPGTAKLVARQMGLPSPKTEDLITPEKNIAMGGFYLGQLLEQFGGNRILATAAYNAGPSRIERVLLRQTKDMPADIWIENLPYGETREYIKNVLAFSVIYAAKLDLERPLLAQEERQIAPKNRATALKN